MNLYIQLIIHGAKKLAALASTYQPWLVGVGALATATVVVQVVIPKTENTAPVTMETKVEFQKTNTSTKDSSFSTPIQNSVEISQTSVQGIAHIGLRHEPSTYQEPPAEHFDEETNGSTSYPGSGSMLPNSQTGPSNRITEYFRNPTSLASRDHKFNASEVSKSPDTKPSHDDSSTWSGSTTGKTENSIAKVSAVSASVASNTNPSPNPGSNPNPNTAGSVLPTSTDQPNLGWAPVVKAFGNVLVSKNSASETFTLTNSGNINASGCGAPIITDSTNFTIVTDNCTTANVASNGGTCTVEVKANPTSTGVKTTTLSRTCTLGGTPTTTMNQITATGTEATLAWLPLTHDYGDILVGALSSVQTFTLTNSGSADATGCTTPTLSNSNDFTITTHTCGTANLDSNNDTCTVEVKANPTSEGSKTTTLSRSCTVGGTITTTSNEIKTGGIQTELAWDIQENDFTTVVTGIKSNEVLFTLKNTGSAEAKGCSAPELSNKDDFYISNDGCETRSLDAKTGECSIKIVAQPKEDGIRVTTLSRTCTVGGTVTTSRDKIIVEGVSPKLSWDLTTFDFGKLQSGEVSRAQTFILTNDGSTDATKCDPPILSDNKNFKITSDTCDTNDLPSKGGSCEVQIQANPQQSGRTVASLERTCEIGGLVATKDDGLFVEIESSILGFDKDSFDFGDLRLGDPKYMTITLINMSKNVTSEKCGAATLSAPGEFFISQDGCQNVELAPGDKCDIEFGVNATKQARSKTTLLIQCGSAGATTLEDGIQVNGI